MLYLECFVHFKAPITHSHTQICNYRDHRSQITHPCIHSHKMTDCTSLSSFLIFTDHPPLHAQVSASCSCHQEGLQQ